MVQPPLPAKALSRPPIVAILGHVDHGKTTLLDTIRQTRVAQAEPGGITQHIGAYQANYKGKVITFIDTPGHAAFAAMRRRGAQVTDLVVLLVAGTEGVKPQTVESIKHIQQANVPFVVAINKKDLPGFSADKVKTQLADHGVLCEGFGGQVPVIAVSAQKNEGIDQLLEIIILLAELEGITADPAAPLTAVIIESHLDPRRGYLASLIVKQGTLSQGDTVYFDSKSVKIRALFSAQGRPQTQALPSEPVLAMGFTSLPPVGSQIQSTPIQPVEPVPVKPPVTPPPPTPATEAEAEAETEPPPTVKVLIKADTMGTLEAIIHAVKQDELVVVHQGVGSVTEADVLLAHNTGSHIIAFNVPVTQGATNLAKIEHVKIQSFALIYELIEFLEKKVLSLLEPSIYEEELGQAEIVQIFKIRGATIAGCHLKTGRFKIKDRVKVFRGEKSLAQSQISSLKEGKTDLKSVTAPADCGLILDPVIDMQVGDMLKSYRIVERV
ncbi:hypothetical protein A2W24_03235 [Microgenomates group bacterium RBG_16_45_19]|nr:MAG: hypothetical protein A2W24_03235 [Microgenomates group bacterium RBG_16_45_19]